MSKVIETYLSADQLAERLGTTRKTINQLAREKHLTRARGLFPWPQAKYEFGIYQQKRLINQPLLAEKKLRSGIIENEQQMVPIVNPDLQISDEDIPKEDDFETSIDKRKKDLLNLSFGEQIIDALKKRIDGSENSAFHWSRALNESIKARTSMLEMLEQESKTLKRAEVETWLYNVSRQNRDSWLNWPQRVAVEMAEQLGVDTRLLNDILMKSVRENLERNTTLPSQFGNNSGESISEGAEATTEA